MCRSAVARLVAQRAGQRQLEFLVELFKQSESFDESAIVRRVIDQAADATGSPLAYMYFVDPTRKTMTLAAWRDRTQPHVDDGQCRAASRRARGPVHRMRACAPSNLQQRSHAQAADGWLAGPAALSGRADDRGDETVAMLGVANREAGYGEDDQRALSALADGVWRVLQSKRAHAMTLGSLQRTDVALQGMIDSMVRMSRAARSVHCRLFASTRCAGRCARPRSRARWRTPARAARGRVAA